MTLTTDELRQIVETDHVQCGDAAAMARELLANREAQPVAFTSPAQLKKYPNEQREAYGQYSEKFCVPLYTAPPTPVNAAAWEMRYWSDGYNIWGDWERISEGLYTRLSAEHATDNDYEFRVLYDAPPAPGVEEVRR